MTDEIELADEIADRIDESSSAWWIAIAKRADTERVRAIAEEDESTANQIWFLQTVAETRGTMADAFEDISRGRYREAWPKLEQVEIAIASLMANPFLDLNRYGVSSLNCMVRRWQDLYPYTVFASPEMVIKREDCTVCGQPFTPFSPCGHTPGKVYAGVMCSRLVRDFEFVSIALVRDPVQKYSVVVADPDPNNYELLRYVCERVSGPFVEWDRTVSTAYHDHKLFSDWSDDDPCPCRSGHIYRSCCGPLPGVRMPHHTVCLAEPFPDHLPSVVVQVAPKD